MTITIDDIILPQLIAYTKDIFQEYLGEMTDLKHSLYKGTISTEDVLEQALHTAHKEGDLHMIKLCTEHTSWSPDAQDILYLVSRNHSDIILYYLENHYFCLNSEFMAKYSSKHNVASSIIDSYIICESLEESLPQKNNARNLLPDLRTPVHSTKI